MEATQISVVIPAHNEERRLQGTLSAVTDYLKQRPGEWEVIVVDDGSHDRTAQLVETFAADEPRVRLLRIEHRRGKGHAVRCGMLQARGEFILFSDADLSTPIEELESLCAWFGKGYDIAIGSRELPDSEILVHQPTYRENMGRTFNCVVRALGLSRFIDTQCGFKCFRADVARKVFALQQLDGFCFDVEVLYIADQLGYRIRDVPVKWRHMPESRVRPFIDSLGMLIDLFRIRMRNHRSAAAKQLS